ncbi:MAG: hypothetical protein QOF01_782 [Thermomicrobiales bacterium]|jgi:hypothetical protein|nr:hypothetical protein [Thermomicrobiales bacterium]
MYLSLSELDVAMAHRQELVATSDRIWLTRGAARPKGGLDAGRLRRSAGVALVRVGERLQGCPMPCGAQPAR